LEKLLNESIGPSTGWLMARAFDLPVKCHRGYGRYASSSVAEIPPDSFKQSDSILLARLL